MSGTGADPAATPGRRSRRQAGTAVTVAAAVAAIVLVSVGVIGLVVQPSQLVWSVLLGVVVAGGVHLWDLERAARLSATTPFLCDAVLLAGLATVAVCAVLTGLVIVLGGVSVPVIIVLVLACASWVRRGPRRASRPASAVRDGQVPDEQVLRALELDLDVPGPHAGAADLSIAELCLVWRRSYLFLIETPYGAGHNEVVSLRRELLDELERRDHAGFGRWIDTGARAASDPGRYLSADR